MAKYHKRPEASGGHSPVRIASSFDNVGMEVTDVGRMMGSLGLGVNDWNGSWRKMSGKRGESWGGKEGNV